MIHGFGDRLKHSESRAALWRVASCIFLIYSSKPRASKTPDHRRAALRSVIGKLLDAQDHTIDSPIERDALGVLLEACLRTLRVATQDLTAFRETLRLPVGRRSAASAKSHPRSS